MGLLGHICNYAWLAFKFGPIEHVSLGIAKKGSVGQSTNAKDVFGCGTSLNLFDYFKISFT